jgi:hypothetical protein
VADDQIFFMSTIYPPMIEDQTLPVAKLKGWMPRQTPSYPLPTSANFRNICFFHIMLMLDGSAASCLHVLSGLLCDILPRELLFLVLLGNCFYPPLSIGALGSVVCFRFVCVYQPINCENG